MHCTAYQPILISIFLLKSHAIDSYGWDNLTRSIYSAKISIFRDLSLSYVDLTSFNLVASLIYIVVTGD